jgi:hypothetical protein
MFAAHALRTLIQRTDHRAGLTNAIRKRRSWFDSHEAGPPQNVTPTHSLA